MMGKTYAHLKGLYFDVIIVFVMGVTREEGYGRLDAPTRFHVDFHYRIDNQQTGIALIALSVQVKRVDGGEVFLFVTFPRVQMEILGVQDESAKIDKLYMGFRLDAISTTHIVVAVDDVVVVALRPAKQDSTKEHPLLQTLQNAHLGKTTDESGTNRSGLANAIGRQVGAIFHGLRIVVVEMLVDAKFGLDALVLQHGLAP